MQPARAASAINRFIHDIILQANTAIHIGCVSLLISLHALHRYSTGQEPRLSNCFLYLHDIVKQVLLILQRDCACATEQAMESKAKRAL